jgi:hypothetical protein
VKSRAALPGLKIDLPSVANHNCFHAGMLNRGRMSSDESRDEKTLSALTPLAAMPADRLPMHVERESR